MWINGNDPETLGWTLTGLTGWSGGLRFTRTATALPGLAGVLPASYSTAAPREIEATFFARLPDVTARDAAIRALQDLLTGLLWVRFDDSPTRVVRCVASPVRVTPVHQSVAFAVPDIDAAVTLTCYDAASYDAEPRVVALPATATRYPVPLGSLPSAGQIIWKGAWSAGQRSLTVRDVGGVVRASLQLEPPPGESLSGNGYLEIDLARRYVTNVAAAGTRTNAYSWLVSGWPVLDPAWQDTAAARYATIEISHGTAELYYRRAYAL